MSEDESTHSNQLYLYNNLHTKHAVSLNSKGEKVQKPIYSLRLIYLD